MGVEVLRGDVEELIRHFKERPKEWLSTYWAIHVLKDVLGYIDRQENQTVRKVP